MTRLTQLAQQLDGADPRTAKPLLEEFNELAGTDEQLSNFRNIPGVCEYETHVRSLLTASLTTATPGIGKGALARMFQRLLDDPTDDSYIEFVIATVETTFGDKHVSDLVFWPGHYFGDGDHTRELSATEMADAVISRSGNNIDS